MNGNFALQGDGCGYSLTEESESGEEGDGHLEHQKSAITCTCRASRTGPRQAVLRARICGTPPTQNSDSPGLKSALAITT